MSCFGNLVKDNLHWDIWLPDALKRLWVLSWENSGRWPVLRSYVFLILSNGCESSLGVQRKMTCTETFCLPVSLKLLWVLFLGAEWQMTCIQILCSPDSLKRLWIVVQWHRTWFDIFCLLVWCLVFGVWWMAFGVCVHSKVSGRVQSQQSQGSDELCIFFLQWTLSEWQSKIVQNLWWSFKLGGHRFELQGYIADKGGPWTDFLVSNTFLIL